MDKETLEKIVEYHTKHVDKLYRMWGGLASQLTDVMNNTLFITIKVSVRWRKDNHTTARQLAACWKDRNPELQHAKDYVVKIVPIEGITGFALNLEQLKNTRQTAHLIQWLGQECEWENENLRAVQIAGNFRE